MAATNFHAFTLNLETDSHGNFYFAKATPWPPASGGVPAEVTPHHGVLFKWSPDGQKTDIIATGLRNPNGLSIGRTTRSTTGLFSVRNPGQIGPDPVDVRSVRLSADQRSVFLQIPSLVAGAAGGSVPMMQSLPDQIEASMGVVMAIDYKLRTAEGAALDQVVHKTIHRVPSGDGSPPVTAALTNPPPRQPVSAHAPAAATNRTAPTGGRVVELRSTGIELAYDVAQIVAKAGETLRFVTSTRATWRTTWCSSRATPISPVSATRLPVPTRQAGVPAAEADRIIAATALAEPTEKPR